MTDPTQPTELEQLDEQYENGLISRQVYYQRKRILISQQEFIQPRATIASTSGVSASIYAPSASSVVGLGVVLLVLGSILFGANPDERLLSIIGLLGVIVGTLLIGAGVIAYGVRVGVMQAYAKMGITGRVEVEDENDGD